MMKRGLAFMFMLNASFAFCLDLDKYQTSWKQLTQQPKALYQFLEGMPKGADLHLHASGAVQTEKLVDIAKNHRYCINKQFEILKPINGKCPQAYFSDQFLQSSYYRKKTIEAWSMQNFHDNAKEDGKSHFFKTFEKFSFLTYQNWPEIIADVVDKAHDQHIQYLELMLSMHGLHPKVAFSAQDHSIGDVLRNRQCHQYIQDNVAYFRGLKKQVQAHTPWLGEDVEVSWILEIKRNQTFDQFWVDAVMVFAIANRVHDIVAVNMVQPEYTGYAQRDYLKQIRFLNLLSRYYPNVKLVLHSGEVPLSSKEQNDHIKLVLDYLHPIRIGHGTDILNEKHSDQLLSKLSQRDIAVEINLTSNQQILGVKGEAHPLKAYLQAQVPVVISSDDPGISRSDLTHEYYHIVNEQKISLNDLVQANRNSLTYSFLPGQSLWDNPKTASPVKPCVFFNSISCIRFIAKNPKAYHQWLLEQQLNDYFRQLEIK